MRLWTFIASVCVLLVSGCSSSIHPLLTDAQLAHDIELNGTWIQFDAPDTYRIPNFICEGFDDNSRYDVTLLPETKTASKETRGKQIPREYEMRIGKLGGQHYLQLARSKQISGGPAFLEGVVTYTWAKLALKDDVLRIYRVDDQAVENLLPKSGLAHLIHKPSDLARNIVITESTAKLQAFIGKHHAKLFSTTPLTFRRKPKDRG